MAAKPTIFFLPGAWHHANCWDGVRSALQESGFETSAIDLPLNDPKELSDDAFLRDVQAIKTQLYHLIEEEGRDLIQVMHSYSGCPGSEALKGSAYQKDVRLKEGRRGGMIGLVYCTAFMLPANMAALEYTFQINAGGNTKVEMKDGLSVCSNPMDTFYFDLPTEVAAKAVDELVPCDTNAFGTTFVTYAAYENYPTTYIVCENDRSLLPTTQRWSINRAKEDGVDINIVRLKSGHMPMLKDPEAMSRCIQEIARGLQSSE